MRKFLFKMLCRNFKQIKKLCLSSAPGTLIKRIIIVVVIAAIVITAIAVPASIASKKRRNAFEKAKFFSFYNIESENETAAGNAKWDRKEIERLQKLLDNLIEEKE